MKADQSNYSKAGTMALIVFPLPLPQDSLSHRCTSCHVGVSVGAGFPTNPQISALCSVVFCDVSVCYREALLMRSGSYTDPLGIRIRM